MGGAGAVVGAMKAIAGRKAKANVVGICGLVENMPDGNAQRPGDVVTTMSGQTVEVINNDAEGRLVLCDAITWAQKEFSPKTIVDLATLTGAMVISLGHEYAGIFANDETLAASLLAAGESTGDKLWRQPLGDAYDRLIDSPIADMKNVGRAKPVRSPRRSSSSATSTTALPGPISTSPAWPGRTRPTPCSTRARPVTACACSTSSSPTRSRAAASYRCGSTSTNWAMRRRKASSHRSASGWSGGAAPARHRRRRGLAGAARSLAVGPGRGKLPSPRPCRRQ